MMSSQLTKYLEKITHHLFTLSDAQGLLSLKNDEDWDTFFTEFEHYNLRLNPKHLKIYTPGKNFPAISVTGNDCELHCEHCDRKYLNSMLQAPTEEEFHSLLEDLVKRGTHGALLSGGCLADGKVPLLKYRKTIKEFKTQNKFFINAHVGLISAEEADILKECGIDTVSFDLILDQHVISEVFHLNKTPQEYILCYENLQKAGLRVVPHILIGAYFGKIGTELRTLEYLFKNPPELVVFISMIPPKEPMEQKIKFQIMPAELIARYILIGRIFLPKAEISLGCMRVRGLSMVNLERWAIQCGINRIEIPSQTTLKWIQEKEFCIEYFTACCAVTADFESKSRALNILGDIKKK